MVGHVVRDVGCPVCGEKPLLRRIDDLDIEEYRTRSQSSGWTGVVRELRCGGCHGPWLFECACAKIQCPWCSKEVSMEEYAAHIDSHKDPSYDRKIIQESHAMHYLPPTGIDPEMITFTRCLAKKLTPLPSPGEYPSGKDGVIARLLKRRVEYESEIYDIFMGNRRLDVFFSNERRS